jgi:hypothetical protein
MPKPNRGIFFATINLDLRRLQWYHSEGLSGKMREAGLAPRSMRAGRQGQLK